MISEDRRLVAALDRTWDGCVELTQNLVRARSVSGAESAAQALVWNRVTSSQKPEVRKW